MLMKVKFAVAVVIAAFAAPVAAHAQGIIGGGKEGVAKGQQAAGPLGAVVGGIVGGIVGGVVGGVKGVIGIPQETGPRRRN
jgi:hypothetical protein